MQFSDGHAAIVTGGASGLGNASAKALAEQGFKVAIFDINTDDGPARAEEIGGTFHHVNIMDEQAVVDGFEAARAAHGQERLTVHCAMASQRGKTISWDKENGCYKKLPTEHYAFGAEGILTSSFRIASHSALGMANSDPITEDGERGAIILTASVAAQDGQIGQVIYGSCNYILTRMEDAGLPYEDVFNEANALGYLEADPELDVGGIDAGHKLALLSAIAFGTQVDFDAVELEGIGSVTIEDIRQAADMGFKIKLLGVAQMTGRGLEQRMSPCLVPDRSPLGQLQGGTNMVVLEGDAVTQVVLRGPGAGEGPTASAVMGDVMDLARGLRISTFGQPAKTLRKARAARAAVPAPYYLRMQLVDKPGALAKVAKALGEAGISIDRMRQYGHQDSAAPVLIVTHKTTRNALDDAIAAFEDTGVVQGTPVAIRIEAV